MRSTSRGVSLRAWHIDVWQAVEEIGILWCIGRKGERLGMDLVAVAVR